jgi:lipid A 3-O-deacylase
MNIKLIFKLFLIQIFTTPILNLSAQTESASTPKSAPQYMRLNIQNDMLIPRDKTDRYFSSGIKMEYMFMQNPNKNGIINKVFPKLPKANNYTGLSVASNMYTPANKSENVIVGDRPYAGWAYLGLVGISNDYINATRFTTEYSLGAIGPITQQEYFQTRVHQIIKRPLPQGWKNQIANDIAINMNFVGEKRLIKPINNIDMMGILETNIGTVNNYVGAGGMVRVGWFEDYFRNIAQVKGRNNWQLYAFARPLVRLVADNSLLQGGMFTYYKSPYVIPKDDLKRVYMNAELGYGLTYRNFNVTYSQNIRTAEFKDAKTMFWGALTMACGF